MYPRPPVADNRHYDDGRRDPRVRHRPEYEYGQYKQHPTGGPPLEDRARQTQSHTSRPIVSTDDGQAYE
eukprot:1250924-Amorphochlora_amoeboformis.AAC.1